MHALSPLPLAPVYLRVAIRCSDSNRVMYHCELQDKFGVRQRPALLPRIRFSQDTSRAGDGEYIAVAWDIWNFGRAIATGVTIEVSISVRAESDDEPRISLIYS